MTRDKKLNSSDCFAQIKVSKTKNTGLGLFSETCIPKGALICVLRGKVHEDVYNENYKIGSKWVGIDRNLWIIVSKTNPIFYINHSCDHNSIFIKKSLLVSTRNINFGDEITIDYSLTEEDPAWKMSCKCESIKCRKVIKSNAHF